MKPCKFQFTYSNHKDANYSKPSISVYLPNHFKGVTYLGDKLFDISSQCDKDRGFSIFQSYSLTVEMRIDSYEYSQAVKLLAKVSKDSRSLTRIVRNLKKAGAVRYSSCDVGKGTEIYQREFIPRKYRRKGQAYWEAMKAGLKVAA